MNLSDVAAGARRLARTGFKVEDVSWPKSTPLAEAMAQDEANRARDEAVARDLLGKMGVDEDNMPHALEAVKRCQRVSGWWDVTQSADFVGTALAISAMRGPGVVLLAELARVATR